MREDKTRLAKDGSNHGGGRQRRPMEVLYRELEPLNLYFEHEYEENGGHQKVVASYEERYASGNGYPQPAGRPDRWP